MKPWRSATVFPLFPFTACYQPTEGNSNALNGDLRQWLKQPFTDPMLLQQGGRRICDEDLAVSLKLLFTLQQVKQWNYLQRWPQHWYRKLLIIIPCILSSPKTSTALGRTHNKDVVQRRFTLEVQHNFQQYTEMEVVASWHFLFWQWYCHNGSGCIGSTMA